MWWEIEMRNSFGCAAAPITTAVVAIVLTTSVGGSAHGASNNVGQRTAHAAVARFATPRYFRHVTDDAYFNTVGPSNNIIATADDSTGVNDSCTRRGTDIAILQLRGPDPDNFATSTINCMTSFGPRAGSANSPDGCSWKTGGITRIRHTIYLAVARQLEQCSYGKETNGLQPSYNASISRSVDGGRTWTNPWGRTSRNGAAPPWVSRLHHFRSMFPGRRFSAPFFIQYGPGNTHAVDGGSKDLSAVSTNGYAYNGSYLHLARVPLKKVQTASAWQFYHGRVGGPGHRWTGSLKGATRILRAKHGVS